MRIEVALENNKPIPEMRLIKFRVDTENPAKTPHIMLNFWTITHTSGSTIRSSAAALSWDVVPQLYNISIFLVGRLKAASAQSSIAVSFAPVNDADELTMSALLPTGFDFTGAITSSVGHEVIATSLETIRVRASMYANTKVDIRIENFKLGQLGGPTQFNLVTKLNNGKQMDEALRYRGGFRLPGHLRVQAQRLTSVYQMDPQQYPIASLWEARMGEPARAEFEFTVTMPGKVGDMLKLRSTPYTLYGQGFTIRSPKEVVTAEIISFSVGELVARLAAMLYTDTVYTVTVNVLTPLVPLPTDSMWAVEIFDGNALASNTNDAQTVGFRLVDILTLRVQANRAPPRAEIQAEVIVDPKKLETDIVITDRSSWLQFYRELPVLWWGEQRNYFMLTNRGYWWSCSSST